MQLSALSTAAARIRALEIALLPFGAAWRNFGPRTWRQGTYPTLDWGDCQRAAELVDPASNGARRWQGM
jgi:hypothetical protein